MRWACADITQTAMPSAIYAALFFTVVLLVTTAYFLMGGLPLLILKHDTPMDAWFVRRFFAIYYKSVFYAAGGAAASYALSGRFAFAIGATAIGLVAVALRRGLVRAMELIGVQIQENGASAIARFRRLHCVALLTNLTQLIVIVWSLTRLSL
jgi:hypothetical protein